MNIKATDARHEEPGRGRTVLLGFIAVLLVGLYMLLWWNRGLAANSIGASVPEDFLAGKFPYRDFYVFITPIHLLIQSGLMWMFGTEITVLRGYGVFERMAIVGLTYYWVSRRFSPFAAFVGCVAMGVSCSGATSEMLFHYNFHAIVFALIAVICADHVFEGGRSYGGAVRLSALSGFFSCLVFFSKQPTGLVVSAMLFIFLVVVYRDGQNRPRPLGIGLAFAAAWLVPLAGFALWLNANGALAAAIDQTLVSGPTAKGPLWSLILRPVILTFGSVTLIAAAAIAVLVVIVGSVAWARAKPSVIPVWTGFRSRQLFWLPAALAIVAGVLLSRVPEPASGAHLLNSISFVFIYVCQLASVGAVVWYSTQWLRGKLGKEEIPFWLASAFCSALLYSFSLSFPVFEIMFVPVLAFLVAYLLDNLRAREQGSLFAFVCAACLLLIGVEVCHKFISPYDWDIWGDGNVWTATTEPRIPQLKGIYLEPRSAAFLEKVTNDIIDHSQPNDPVLVFPSFPLFYSMANRRPNTFSDSHFTDTTPDRLANSDGLIIAAAHPKVIVLVETDEGRFAIQEKMYRAAGVVSGQRKLRDQIREMIKSYRLIDSVTIPTSGTPVKVYVRE